MKMFIWLTIGGLETPSDKGNGKTVLVSDTILYHTLKSGKVPSTAVGNIIFLNYSNKINYYL